MTKAEKTLKDEAEDPQPSPHQGVIDQDGDRHPFFRHSVEVEVTRLGRYWMFMVGDEDHYMHPMGIYTQEGKAKAQRDAFLEKVRVPDGTDLVVAK